MSGTVGQWRSKAMEEEGAESAKQCTVGRARWAEEEHAEETGTGAGPARSGMGKGHFKCSSNWYMRFFLGRMMCVEWDLDFTEVKRKLVWLSPTVPGGGIAGYGQAERGIAIPGQGSV